jgi:HEAT repeat protein
LLADGDARVRTIAVQVLREFGTSAVEPLIRALSNSDKNIRVQVIKLLGATKDVRATEPIMNALKDSDVDVRNAAAEAVKGLNITAIPTQKETIKEIV